MIVSLIVAFGKNRELGKDNKLLLHLPEDLKNFKRVTNGHYIIMGRKTFESIPEQYRPLPNRTNIVVTRNEEWNAKGVVVARSLEDAILLAKDGGEDEVFICGGGQIYKEAMEKDLVDRLYLTKVEWEGEADTFFPELDEGKWDVKSSEIHEVSDINPFRWKFEILEKIQ
jgi:dihydrofolate reductase